MNMGPAAILSIIALILAVVAMARPQWPLLNAAVIILAVAVIVIGYGR